MSYVFWRKEKDEGALKQRDFGNLRVNKKEDKLFRIIKCYLYNRETRKLCNASYPTK